MVTTLSPAPQVSLYGTPSERILFGHSVEVLHSIHSLQRSNAIAKERNSSFVLDAEILYHAIQHLLEARPFSSSQLIAYFSIQQSLEEFHCTLEDELQATFEAHLPYAVDFFLLGMDTAVYSELEVNDRTLLHQHYEALLWEFFQKDLSPAEFVLSAQNLILEKAAFKESV